ncbi:MAG: DNA recombination protein RmuC, partial [Proteobacteria bacterium]
MALPYPVSGCLTTTGMLTVNVPMLAHSTPEILIILAVLALIAIALYLLWKRLERLPGQLDAGLNSGLSPLLGRSFLDLTDRMNRLIADLRESSSANAAKLNSESQERLERALFQNRSELQAGLARSSESLEKRFQSLEKQVSDRLEKIGQNVETKLNENLKEGFKHFEKVQEHLQAAEIKLVQLGQVGDSITSLNQLLKLPHLRGSFGEATLERLLADFLPAHSYTLQAQIQPGSTERVDVAVHLGRQTLPIDAKFPREQVLPLFESGDPAAIEVARKNLADFIRSQSRSIAEKYIKPEHGTTDMALLFLPSETLYFEVIRNGKLFEDMAKLRVFPVSPNTLAMGLQ